MARILPTFTAAILLFHALLGCCWLHAKGGMTGTHEHAATCAAGDCCPEHKCAEHEHHDDGCEHPAKPCGCELNCHRLCVYLPPDRATFELSHPVLAIAIVAEPTMLFADHLACTAERLCPLRAEVAPPLRLHLMHQLLLV
jgi:hypothetical protein